MGHNSRQIAEVADGLVIVPDRNLRADTLTTGLEHTNANHTGPGALFLDDRMQLALHRVEFERYQASLLWSDLQAVFGKVRKILFQPLSMRQVASDCINPVHLSDTFSSRIPQASSLRSDQAASRFRAGNGQQ